METNWKQKFKNEFEWIDKNQRNWLIIKEMEFIQTEIIEKLVDGLPDTRSTLGQGFGSIKNDLSLLKQQLKSKWLK